MGQPHTDSISRLRSYRRASERSALGSSVSEFSQRRTKAARIAARSTTRPPCSTVQIRRVLRMSASGSASRIAKSAHFPTSIDPSSFPAPMIRAAELVAARIASASVRPAATSSSSSGCTAVGRCHTSVPVPTVTPARASLAVVAHASRPARSMRARLTLSVFNIHSKSSFDMNGAASLSTSRNFGFSLTRAAKERSRSRGRSARVRFSRDARRETPRSGRPVRSKDRDPLPCRERRR